MLPSGPSATSFGWFRPAASVVIVAARRDPLDSVVERVGDVNRPVGGDHEPVRPVEAAVVRARAGGGVTADDSSEELRDPEIARRIVGERRRLLEHRHRADRPARSNVPDPPLVVDDAEAAARIDGNLDREPDRGLRRRAVVAGPAGAAVPRDEREPVTGESEDTVGEVGHEQRAARLDHDVERVSQPERGLPDEHGPEPLTAGPERPAPGLPEGRAQLVAPGAEAAHRHRLSAAPEASRDDWAAGRGDDADPSGAGLDRAIRHQPRLGHRRARDHSREHGRAGTAQHGRARQEPHIGFYTDGARKVPATLSAWPSSATSSPTSSRTSLSRATSSPSSPTRARSLRSCSSRSRAR